MSQELDDRPPPSAPTPTHQWRSAGEPTCCRADETLLSARCGSARDVARFKLGTSVRMVELWPATTSHGGHLLQCLH